MSDLQIEILTTGTGDEAITLSRVSVHYHGWLSTKTRDDPFDSSVVRGEPFEFVLGLGAVIAGWDEGVAGMKVGGKRILTVPPSLGYGARGYPPVIPGDSTLIFEVELLDVT
jgi:FKBP-type peptidyl-prolyl cis-trans isomerase